MTSTARIGWVVGLVAMTIGYLWSVFHHFDYAAATLAYGPFVAGTKVWEKFLTCKYGAKDEIQKEASRN